MPGDSHLRHRTFGTGMRWTDGQDQPLAISRRREADHHAGLRCPSQRASARSRSLVIRASVEHLSSAACRGHAGSNASALRPRGPGRRAGSRPAALRGAVESPRRSSTAPSRRSDSRLFLCSASRLLLPQFRPHRRPPRPLPTPPKPAASARPASRAGRAGLRREREVASQRGIGGTSRGSTSRPARTFPLWKFRAMHYEGLRRRAILCLRAAANPEPSRGSTLDEPFFISRAPRTVRSLLQLVRTSTGES